VLERKQERTMRLKDMAFAAFTKYGRCMPPAPNEFIAPHIPGARKLQRPSMKQFQYVDLYQVTV
jgi:hypothetical protein